MNLVEARKLGHDGYVRSPTRSGGEWCRLKELTWTFDGPEYSGKFELADLDTEDWEPMPKPPDDLFEADVWVSENARSLTDSDMSEYPGWRRIRVREVRE